MHFQRALLLCALWSGAAFRPPQSASRRAGGRRGSTSEALAPPAEPAAAPAAAAPPPPPPQLLPPDEQQLRDALWSGVVTDEELEGDAPAGGAAAAREELAALLPEGEAAAALDAAGVYGSLDVVYDPVGGPLSEARLRGAQPGRGEGAARARQVGSRALVKTNAVAHVCAGRGSAVWGACLN